MILLDIYRFVRKPENWLFYILAISMLGGLLYLAFPRVTHPYNVREVNNSLVMDVPDLAREYGEKVTPEDSKPLPVDGVADSLITPILMYHHVGMLPLGADSIRQDLTVSVSDFETQVSWLHEAGFTSITLEQLYMATQGTFVMPKKPVVFTFDDGYSDVFEYAVPVLKKYGYVGSFAVVSGFIGSPEYATWVQVLAARQGGMEIVSHTYDHFDGSNQKFSKEFIRKNLELSLSDLDSHIGSVPRILVYPYGHYTPMYMEAAREAGFVMALTVHFGTAVRLDNLLETPRVRVHGNQAMDTFKKNVSGK